MVALMVV
jgi:predicted metal-binding protein